MGPFFAQICERIDGVNFYLLDFLQLVFTGSFMKFTLMFCNFVIEVIYCIYTDVICFINYTTFLRLLFFVQKHKAQFRSKWCIWQCRCFY